MNLMIAIWQLKFQRFSLLDLKMNHTIKFSWTNKKKKKKMIRTVKFLYIFE